MGLIKTGEGSGEREMGFKGVNLIRKESGLRRDKGLKILLTKEVILCKKIKNI